MISISQSSYEVGLTGEQNKAYFECELLMHFEFFCKLLLWFIHVKFAVSAPSIGA